jgi:hypothetical protein
MLDQIRSDMHKHSLSHVEGTYRPLNAIIKSSSPVIGLEWPRRFQEVKVLRFHDKGTGWW